MINIGTFTITQKPTSANAYFIPNANGCATQLTPVGETNNWECVDDPSVTPDDDATYVYSKATNEKYDLYALPDHTTESGTINYVQIYGRAKAANFAQHEDGTFKLILTDDVCSNIYKSSDIDLVTSYNTYNNVWTTNPRTSSAFTWSDIDNLLIGTECSGPSATEETNITLRPNGNGDTIEWSPSYPHTNWECVDESVADDYTSYVYVPTDTWKIDLYDINTNTDLTGRIIKSVSVFARVRYSGSYSHAEGAKLLVKPSGGAIDYSDWLPIGYGWVTISNSWSLNPDDGLAWEKSDIDDLQVGIYGNGRIGHFLNCTQVYVVVTYYTDDVAEVRTTQCYAKVNYTTPPTSCTLDKPEEISVDHDQNIKMLNFWSGNRTVYGLARNNRTMVMSGILYSDTACTTVECVRELAEDGVTVSLSGLGSNDYDKEVKIISFGWKKISDKPLAYNWILECEFQQ